MDCSKKKWMRPVVKKWRLDDDEYPLPNITNNLDKVGKTNIDFRLPKPNNFSRSSQLVLPTINLDGTKYILKLLQSQK